MIKKLKQLKILTKIKFKNKFLNNLLVLIRKLNKRCPQTIINQFNLQNCLTIIHNLFIPN